MSKKNGLKPEERDELENWTPGFLSLEVHNELEFQINECRQGREDAVVIGPRGTGKTHAVEHFCSQLAHKEVARSIEDPSYQPEEILYFESSLARGRKTGLLDLYEQVYGGGSVVGSRLQRATTLISHIVTEIRSRNITLVCIDEAQLINPGNLDLLRQVPDAARRQGHRMGLLLVGNEELRDSLVEIKQLGQRFSAQVTFPPFSRETIAPHLTGFHPHLKDLKSSLDGKQWNKLEKAIFSSANGSIRRLVRLLQKANSLAVRFDSRIDEEVLELAMAGLAKEE